MYILIGRPYARFKKGFLSKMQLNVFTHRKHFFLYIYTNFEISVYSNSIYGFKLWQEINQNECSSFFFFFKEYKYIQVLGF